MLFGLGLLLSGIIGFVGWCTTAVQTVQPGAVSSLLGCLNGTEWIVLVIFALMAIAGLIISFIEFKKE